VAILYPDITIKSFKHGDLWWGFHSSINEKYAEMTSVDDFTIIEIGASIHFTINHTGISAAMWVRQCHKPLIWEW
jgi:hypothetical protein